MDTLANFEHLKADCPMTEEWEDKANRHGLTSHHLFECLKMEKYSFRLNLEKVFVFCLNDGAAQGSKETPQKESK